MSITASIKALIPRPAKRTARNLVKAIKYRARQFAIRRPVARGETMRIIVGAAETHQHGWYSTNEQWLDISKRSDWDKVFGGKQLITHVVAEHVFEHLTYDECRQAIANMSTCMVDGGRVRIAVPDGYHPDRDYQAHVGIGGIGDDAADHKQVLNVDVLTELLRESGFEPTMIEGYERTGRLITKSYSAEDGFVRRSRVNRGAGAAPSWNFVDADTSLIVDGIKVR